MMKKGIIAAALTLAVALFGAHSALATNNFRADASPTVRQGETVDSSVYLAGQTVSVDGTVNGDVYCAGQSVTINGTVNGDVICAGQTVAISGDVRGSVRAAAQTLTVSGKVSKSVTLMGQQITIEKTAAIADDATLTGADVMLQGSLGRDVVAAGATLTLNGATINRNVTTAANTITINSSSRVGGNFEYTSQNQFTPPSGTVVGQLTFHRAEKKQQTIGSGIMGALLGALMLIASWLILALVAPRAFHGLTADAMRRPGRVALLGVAGGIVVPVLALFAMITVLGVPLGILIIVGWVLALLLGGPIAAYLIGRLVLPNVRNALLFMLVGSVIVVIIYNIPLLNVLFVLATWALSIGVLLSYWFNHSLDYTLGAAPAKSRGK